MHNDMQMLGSQTVCLHVHVYVGVRVWPVHVTKEQLKWESLKKKEER